MEFKAAGNPHVRVDVDCTLLATYPRWIPVVLLYAARYWRCTGPVRARGGRARVRGAGASCGPVAGSRRRRSGRSAGRRRPTGSHPDLGRRRRFLAAGGGADPVKPHRRLLPRPQPRVGGRPRLGDPAHHRRRRHLGAGLLGSGRRGAVLRRVVLGCRKRRRHRRLRQLLHDLRRRRHLGLRVHQRRVRLSPAPDQRDPATGVCTSLPKRAWSTARTTAGRHGTELPSPYEGSFFGVLPLEDDVVLLFGLRGHLFRSEDAGESWIEIETGTVAMLTDGIRLPDGRIVITGSVAPCWFPRTGAGASSCCSSPAVVGYRPRCSRRKTRCSW